MSVEESTLVGTFETAGVEQRAKEDMNFLAALCLPSVVAFPFPDVFLGMWLLAVGALNKTRDFSKFAFGLPRGHGKTTILKILIIYAILFTTRRFILVVGANEDRAENIITDVAAILDSPNILAVFGNWRASIQKDTAGLKHFTFRGRSIILAGLGSGSSLRGMNIDNMRPDFVICDDMQTQKEAESVSSSQKLIKWLVGTLMKAKNPRNCTFLYVGNMYRDVKIGGAHSEIYTCILRNLQRNPSWISWIVGAILADGKALWEEVQPYDQLIAELQSDSAMGCADVFFAEVQNDPTCGGGTHFDISKLPEWNLNQELELPIGKFLLIDPSLGKSTSDKQIVGEFWVFDQIPRLWKLHIRQTTAPKLVEWCLDYAVVEGIPLIVAESVAYQGTLLQWFDHFVQIRRLEGIHLRPVSPGGRSKASRIVNMFKALMGGTTQVHPTTLAQVLSQISTYDPLKTQNSDDILDVVAYAQDVMLQYTIEMQLPDIYSLVVDQWSTEIEQDNCVF